MCGEWDTNYCAGHPPEADVIPCGDDGDNGDSDTAGHIAVEKWTMGTRNRKRKFLPTQVHLRDFVQLD